MKIPVQSQVHLTESTPPSLGPGAKPPVNKPPLPESELNPRETVSRPLSQGEALPHIEMLEAQQVRGGPGKMQDLAISNDSWGQLDEKYKALYPAGRKEHGQHILTLASRTGLSEAQAGKILDGLKAKNTLFFSRDYGKIELFFKKFGTEKALKLFNTLQQNLENPKSRLNEREKQNIFDSSLQDITIPAMIGQGGKGSCAACSINVAMASGDPLKYINNVNNLAEGKPVDLPDGQQLLPNDNWRKGNEDRRLSEAVVQDALMDLALGKGKYNSHLDEGANQPAPTAGQHEKALDKLTGNSDYDANTALPMFPFNTVVRQMRSIEDDLARGRPVSVHLWGHAIEVVGMDRSKAQPTVVINTYGSQFEMPVSEFEDLIMSSITIDDPGLDNHKIPAGTRKVLNTDLENLPD